MKNFTSIIEAKLLPFANKLAKQRHLKAIRDAFISIMPVTLAGGIAAVIAAAPVTDTTTNSFLLSWGKFASNNSMILSWINLTSIGAMSLYICIAVAYFLSKNYKMDSLVPVLLSVCGFMMTCIVPKELSWSGNLAEVSYLGGQGLVPALLISLLTVEAYHYMRERNFGKIKLPDSVPASLSEVFASLVPGICIIAVYTLIFIFCFNNGISFPELIYKIISPAMSAADSIWFASFATFLIAFFWFFGIHDAAFAGVLAPIRDSGLSINSAAKLAGEALPRVLTTPFWVYFCAGGITAFSFALLISFSKSKQLKTVGRIGVLPAFFGISEPIMFGTPIMLNPLFFVPYVLAATLNCVIAYLLTTANVIGRTFAMLSWNMPAIFGAGLAAMDIKASLLVVILIIINMAILYPFLKVYEKQLLEQEALENK